MRVAIVHDWLYVLGGAEKVLSAMFRCFPSADLFTLFDTMSDADRAKACLPPSRTTFLQRMPAINRKHRSYLPLMPVAIEQFDLSGYDVIISSSHAVAKGVITGADQLHISYVHSPMRYAWDLQHQCLREARLDHGLKGWIARYILFKMRLWDTRTAAGVDAYLANSHFVSRRIRKVYGRASTVIHPPVDIPAERPVAGPLSGVENNGGFFLAASRLVPYKNMLAIVQAFATMPDKRLVVAGSGPELGRLKAVGAPNVEFVGFVADEELRRLMRTAKAFVFAAEEDFGIVPVEVQGEGTPVIALGRGGLRETVVAEGLSPTGLFFERPEADCIASAVQAFEQNSDKFNRGACYANALRFATPRFEKDFKDFVLSHYSSFKTRLNFGLACNGLDQRVLQQPRPSYAKEQKLISADTPEASAFASTLSKETV